MRELGEVHLQFAMSPRTLCGLTAQFLVGSRVFVLFLNLESLQTSNSGSFESLPSEFQSLQVHTTVPHFRHFVPKDVWDVWAFH